MYVYYYIVLVHLSDPYISKVKLLVSCIKRYNCLVFPFPFGTLIELYTTMIWIVLGYRVDYFWESFDSFLPLGNLDFFFGNCFLMLMVVWISTFLSYKRGIIVHVPFLPKTVMKISPNIVTKIGHVILFQFFFNE